MPSPRPRRPARPPSELTRTPQSPPEESPATTHPTPTIDRRNTRRTHRVDTRKKAEQRLRRTAIITTTIIVTLFYLWLALSQLIPPKAANGQVLPTTLSSDSTPPDPNRIPFARRLQSLVELLKTCYHTATRRCPFSSTAATIPVTEELRRERGDITAPLASFNAHDVGPTR